MNRQPDLPVNLERLNQISEGDIEFEIEILQAYIEDFAQRIERIRDAIAINDWSQIMGQAHHLRGSSGNVGASQIHMLAIQLEELNSSHDSGKALDIIGAMSASIRTIELFIAEKSASLPT